MQDGHASSVWAILALQNVPTPGPSPRLPHMQPPRSMSYGHTQKGDTTPSTDKPERRKARSNSHGRILEGLRLRWRYPTAFYEKPRVRGQHSRVDDVPSQGGQASYSASFIEQNGIALDQPPSVVLQRRYDTKGPGSQHYSFSGFGH